MPARFLDGAVDGAGGGVKETRTQRRLAGPPALGYDGELMIVEGFISRKA